MNINPKEPGRNRPSDEGASNDPYIRDESAQQPGVSTMSSSDTDELNQDITDTSSKNADFDDADLAFDDIDEDMDEDE